MKGVTYIMNKILVVCTGNTCRSPMAEGIIKKIIADNNLKDIEVTSVGLSAYHGDAVSVYSANALEKIGVDIKSHTSKGAMLSDLEEADVIYVMTLHHKNAIIDAYPSVENKIVVMDIADPFGLDLAAYEQCRDKMLEYFEKEIKGE